jgi:hypothetical protein
MFTFGVVRCRGSNSSLATGSAAVADFDFAQARELANWRRSNPVDAVASKSQVAHSYPSLIRSQ